MPGFPAREAVRVLRVHDPQDMNPQYIEDLATGYWRSEVLFAAVEKELFTKLEPEGRSINELASDLGFDAESFKRFIEALSALGLLFEADGYVANTKLSKKYLVRGSENYQGN